MNQRVERMGFFEKTRVPGRQQGPGFSGTAEYFPGKTEKIIFCRISNGSMGAAAGRGGAVAAVAFGQVVGGRQRSG